MSDLNTHGYRMKHSKQHPNELITRVPVSYLKWMVNCKHSEANYASAELARRGTVTPSLDVSGHAIDRASLNCRDIWHQTKNPGEGLHAWLCRMAAEALAHGVPKGEKLAHNRMLFAFERDGVWPVLKTVMREREGKDGGQ